MQKLCQNIKAGKLKGG